LQSQNDLFTISLPIQRELTELKLELSRLLTDILEVNLVQITEINQQNLTKDNVIKTVQSYLAKNDTLTETQQQWQTTMSELPDLILSNLLACYNFSIKIKQYKAQALFLIGRTFRLVSGLKMQFRRTNLNDENSKIASSLKINLPISKWTNVINDLVKLQEKIAFETIETKPTKTKPSKSNATDPLSKPTNDQDENLNTDDTDSSQVLANVLKFYIISNLSNLNEQESLKVII
jgi:hypothetical protein